MRIKVLDSTALFLGFTERSGAKLVTCKEVLEEVKYGGGELRAAAIRGGGLVKILEPNKDYVEKVREEASKVGEHDLSETDIKLLALALQLSNEGVEASIVTSDYSIQNLAKILGLRVEPILHRGIKKVIKWITYCEICGWRGEAEPGTPCPRCGARLKRRPSEGVSRES
ncbi:MAG TPA: hypothetical protein ENF33_00550 [Nitrososphaeria archaeon]|nr:MAG: hypothetical protein DRN68_00060 [Nitrososphaerota archaeon]HDJ66193.1 hypothetical protein [Nitrososphaeria archaeon]